MSENKPKTKEIQRRNWLFTINNPEQSEAELLEYLENLAHVKYVCFGRERGDGTDGNPDGTEHYQGYIEFSQPKDWTTIKNYLSPPNVLPAAHFDPRMGTRRQAHDYVFKINDYTEKAHTRLGEVFEFGTFVDDGERSDLNEMMNDIENGMTNRELSRKYQGKYARHMKWVEEYRQDYLKEKFSVYRENMEVYYIYGDTRTGKTRYVFERHGYGHVYRNQGYENGKWFDGYEMQDVLLLDEYHSSFTFSNLLTYTEGQPIAIQCRFKNKQACYTKVYIVSNLPLSKQYPDIQQNQTKVWEAFIERLTAIYRFDENGMHEEVVPNKKNRKKTAQQLTLLSDKESGKLPF